MQPAVELIDTVEELQAALKDPEAFLQRLVNEAIGPAAIKLAIARLKHVIEPVLPKPLTIADVLPAIELIDSIEELRAAVEAPDEFLEKLMKEAVGPAAIKVAIAAQARAGAEATGTTDMADTWR